MIAQINERRFCCSGDKSSALPQKSKQRGKIREQRKKKLEWKREAVKGKGKKEKKTKIKFYKQTNVFQVSVKSSMIYDLLHRPFPLPVPLLRYHYFPLRCDWPPGTSGFWCIGVTALVLVGRLERRVRSCRWAADGQK